MRVTKLYGISFIAQLHKLLRAEHESHWDANLREEFMNWIEAAGYLASALVLATFCMKTMIALRCAAVCSNVAFVVYGFYDNLYPVLVLHGILLPLNVWRALQMLRLIRRVEAASIQFMYSSEHVGSLFQCDRCAICVGLCCRLSGE